MDMRWTQAVILLLMFILNRQTVINVEDVTPQQTYMTAKQQITTHKHPHSSVLHHYSSTHYPHSSVLHHYSSTYYPHSSVLHHYSSTLYLHSSTLHHYSSIQFTLTGAPITSAPSTLAGAPSFTVAPSSGAFTRAPTTNVIMVSIGACTLFAGVTMLAIAIVLLRKRSLQHHSTLQDSLPMHQLPFSPSSPLSISLICPVLSVEDEQIARRTRSRRQLDYVL